MGGPQRFDIGMLFVLISLGVILIIIGIMLGQTYFSNTIHTQSTIYVPQVEEIYVPIEEETGEFPAPSNTVTATVTAYCLQGTMADGNWVHAGAIACPRQYELGTFAEINGIVYMCTDRTAAHFDGRFDIWMESCDAAIQFGKQTLPVNIY